MLFVNVEPASKTPSMSILSFKRSAFDGQLLLCLIPRYPISDKIESPAMEVDARKWFPEFVKFKEKDRLYTVQAGTVTRTDAGGYRLEVDWPFQAPPGDYAVEVFAVSGGRVVEHGECTLTVARSGMVARLSTLAFNSAPLYGLIAIVVAMASGFAVGAVFKGGGGH